MHMSKTICKPLEVLLIEDNPGDTRLIREMIADTRTTDFNLVSANTLKAARQMLPGHDIDVILLDLSLPDSRGLDTFNAIRECLPEAPIVVLTALDDEDTAIEALHKGAQDYLVKGQVDGELLSRSLRYAVERQRLLSELDSARERQEQLREMRSLERLAAPHEAALGAEPEPPPPLHTVAPIKFAALSQAFGDLLDDALEESVHKTERVVTQELRLMAELMGFLEAGPRDVIDVYCTAVRNKTHDADPGKARAYTQEARLMVLELMGHLASYYQTLSLGSRTTSSSDAGRSCY
jgi:DNA-binding response OmpR family regulator